MGLFVVNLSDVGEGVAEAELIEWHVAVGDTVAEDQLLGVVMTDKAAVDIPSSVMGKVLKLCAEVGDVVAVGSGLVHLDVAGVSEDAADEGVVALGSSESQTIQSATSQSTVVPNDTALNNIALNNTVQHETAQNETAQNGTSIKRVDVLLDDAGMQPLGKVLAAPTVRQRARELGVQLSTVTGSGPGGRIVHADLDRFTERRAMPGNESKRLDDSVQVVKVVGMRRKIAEKMALAKSRIPHITIVEEVDMQYLEELREELNDNHALKRGKLTILPFVMKSIVEAVREQPMLNARYDDEGESISQHNGVHIGVATQTPNGLLVPVVRHAEANSLWENASEVGRLANACRDGQAKREELSGSTITISSLGPLGAVATTPIINHPEVAIIGINKMMIRPVWEGQQFVPKKMMNLSCSFDHRVVDGWDAAVFVQKLKSLLEKPAMLFMEA